MRTFTIAAPTPLRLRFGGEELNGRWEDMPEAARAAALGLLARLIAKGLICEEETRGD